MSAHKEIIRAVANYMVTENVTWRITPDGFLLVLDLHQAVNAACRLLRDGGKEFNYSEVYETVCDIVNARESALIARLKSKL